MLQSRARAFDPTTGTSLQVWWSVFQTRTRADRPSDRHRMRVVHFDASLFQSRARASRCSADGIHPNTIEPTLLQSHSQAFLQLPSDIKYVVGGHERTDLVPIPRSGFRSFRHPCRHRMYQGRAGLQPRAGAEADRRSDSIVPQTYTIQHGEFQALTGSLGSFANCLII